MNDLVRSYQSNGLKMLKPKRYMNYEPMLKLNISYDGLKMEENKTIHSVSVQLQARFK